MGDRKAALPLISVANVILLHALLRVAVGAACGWRSGACAGHASASSSFCIVADSSGAWRVLGASEHVLMCVHWHLDDAAVVSAAVCRTTRERFGDKDVKVSTAPPATWAYPTLWVNHHFDMLVHLVIVESSIGQQDL